jgi:tetratricopeptide (TPR) repeat protein
MKFILVAALLFMGLLCGARAQQVADDQYIGIYGLIQQADHLTETGDPGEALAAYVDAEKALQQFQRMYPDWNPGIVKFRLGQIGKKIVELKQETSSSTTTSAATQMPAPARNATAENASAAQSTLTKDGAELQDLRAQLQTERAANQKLQARLKEALSVQPAAVDPRELAKAREKILWLMKENDLLKASHITAGSAGAVTRYVTNVVTVVVTNTQSIVVTNFAEAFAANPGPTVVTNFVRVLVPDTNALASAQLERAAAVRNFNEEHARAGELEQELKKLALEESAAVTASSAGNAELAALRRENAALKQEIAALRSGSSAEALNEEIKTLRARLAVAEARPVPFTAEELALFKNSAPQPAAPKPGHDAAGTMSASTANLAASAQAHFNHQEFDQAEADYQKILAQDQNNGMALGNIAMIELQQGKLDQARKHLDAALAKNPDDPYNLSTLGYLKFRQGKYEEALNALSRAAKLDPNNPEIENYLGLALSHEGHRQAAESALRRAIRINPDYAPAQNNLAVIYLSQTPPMPELARWHYQKALAAGQPRNPELEKMLAEKGAPVSPQ